MGCLCSLVSLSGLIIPLAISISLAVSVSFIVPLRVPVSSEVLLVELFESVCCVFIDDLQFVGILFFDHLFEVIEVIPNYVKLQVALLLTQIQNLYSFEHFFDFSYASLSPVGEVGDVSLFVGDG